jgi:hypothetical protein
LRGRIGLLMQIAGLILMPLAVIKGIADGGSLSDELLAAGVGFLLIYIGRGLRDGTRRT